MINVLNSTVLIVEQNCFGDARAAEKLKDSINASIVTLMGHEKMTSIVLRTKFLPTSK